MLKIQLKAEHSEYWGGTLSIIMVLCLYSFKSLYLLSTNTKIFVDKIKRYLGFDLKQSTVVGQLERDREITFINN